MLNLSYRRASYGTDVVRRRTPGSDVKPQDAAPRPSVPAKDGRARRTSHRALARGLTCRPPSLLTVRILGERRNDRGACVHTEGVARVIAGEAGGRRLAVPDR